MKRHLIADIHGDMDRLVTVLMDLGYHSDLTHPDGWRPVFLGDYIDRGPNGYEVLETVSGMVRNGLADAIMGNHELNALLYHEDGPDGDGLRPRNPQNTRQHAAFLNQCPLGSDRAERALEIMRSFPLAIDFGRSGSFTPTGARPS